MSRSRNIVSHMTRNQLEKASGGSGALAQKAQVRLAHLQSLDAEKAAKANKEA